MIEPGALVRVFLTPNVSLSGRVGLAMIFGVLSLLNATLTLPGIAGIVLTIGMAVDANVLIYEHIREEVRGGRTAIAAIDEATARAALAGEVRLTRNVSSFS